MATAPVKSQPLHNFSLSFLKWGHKNQMNSNHRFRRPSDTMLWDSPPPQTVENHRSSPSEQESDGGGGSGFKNESENPKLGVGSRSAQRNRFSFASCSLQKQQATVFENEEDVEREKEKVWNDVVEGDESVAKPWNLRPRKAVSKAAVEIGGVSRNGEFQESAQQQQTDNLPKSMRLRGFVEGQGSEKRKFWIALSREEIEEDVYAMTGSRPARRPKKRPKTVQKQVDNVFPGLYLAGVSADYYRVHEALRLPDFVWGQSLCFCEPEMNSEILLEALHASLFWMDTSTNLAWSRGARIMVERYMLAYMLCSLSMSW